MRIVLLHDANAEGGRPDENDALVQVQALGRVLAAAGHEIVPLPLSLDLKTGAARLRELRPQLVFNLVESLAGHGQLIHLAPALLDSLGIAYTGAPADAVFLSSQKLWTKRLLQAAGVPTPGWVEASGDCGGHANFPARYIVKSVWEDASLGLDDDSVLWADSLATLRQEIRRRRADLGGQAFAERFVEGREFNLALLERADGVRVLPIAEMCFADYPAGKPQLVGYKAKWDASSFEYSHTVRRFELPASDAALLQRISDLALACWRLLGLRGYARVDFRVDASGQPWVLEANANPCLSPDAGFVAAAERAGLDLGAVAADLIAAALGASER
jgi:D-alanine-D-alanine ligase